MKKILACLLVLGSFPTFANAPKITCYSTLYGINESGVAFHKEFMNEDIELNNRNSSTYFGAEYHYEFEKNKRYKMIVVGGYESTSDVEGSGGIRINLEDTRKDVQTQSWARTDIVSLDYNGEYSARGKKEEFVNIHCHIKRSTK